MRAICLLIVLTIAGMSASVLAQTHQHDQSCLQEKRTVMYRLGGVKHAYSLFQKIKHGLDLPPTPVDSLLATSLDSLKKQIEITESDSCRIDLEKAFMLKQEAECNVDRLVIWGFMYNQISEKGLCTHLGDKTTSRSYILSSILEGMKLSEKQKVKLAVALIQNN